MAYEQRRSSGQPERRPRSSDRTRTSHSRSSPDRPSHSGKKKKRTWYVQRPFTRNDWLVLALGVALLLASLVITFWDGDRFFNPFI